MSKQCDIRVAIDIGHTPKNAGATSARGLSEYSFNRRMGLELYYKFSELGVNSFFVNSKEVEITLEQRVNSAKKHNATLFLSIHHDSVQKQFLSTWRHKNKKRYFCDDFSGYSIFVSQKNIYFHKSLEIAKHIGTSLRQLGFIPTLHHTANIKGERKKMYDKSLGIYRYDNLVVLKKNTIPAILIECGIIINRDEEDLINNPIRREKFITGITRGVMQECQTEQEIETVW